MGPIVKSTLNDGVGLFLKAGALEKMANHHFWLL